MMKLEVGGEHIERVLPIGIYTFNGEQLVTEEEAPPKQKRRVKKEKKEPESKQEPEDKQEEEKPEEQEGEQYYQEVSPTESSDDDIRRSILDRYTYR